MSVRRPHSLAALAGHVTVTVVAPRRSSTGMTTATADAGFGIRNGKNLGGDDVVSAGLSFFGLARSAAQLNLHADLGILDSSTDKVCIDAVLHGH